MIPDPLHPAVVHLPLVLAFLLPVAALLAWWAIRRGSHRIYVWAVPVGLAVVLTAASWFAVETGEAQEERVEGVVPESALHEHEEAGERLLLFSGITAVLLAGGLAAGAVGAAARIVGTAASIVVLVPAVQVGAAGGELVYRHGAASAYLEGEADPGTVAPEAGQRSTRATLPHLFSIMAGLESDMARVSRGLWAEDFDTVVAGAAAVADHPKIPPEEARRIAGILGEEVSRFRELDAEVHGLADRIRALASREELEGVLSAEAELRQGCITCHTEFRTRLRTGVAAGGGTGP